MARHRRPSRRCASCRASGRNRSVRAVRPTSADAPSARRNSAGRPRRSGRRARGASSIVDRRVRRRGARAPARSRSTSAPVGDDAPPSRTRPWRTSAPATSGGPPPRRSATSGAARGCARSNRRRVRPGLPGRSDRCEGRSSSAPAERPGTGPPSAGGRHRWPAPSVPRSVAGSPCVRRAPGLMPELVDGLLGHRP